MNTWERLSQKPMAEWGPREKWIVRVVSLLIGFFSIEVLYFATWAVRGDYGAPHSAMHLLAMVMAVLALVQTEQKMRRFISKT